MYPMMNDLWKKVTKYAITTFADIDMPGYYPEIQNEEKELKEGEQWSES